MQQRVSAKLAPEIHNLVSQFVQDAGITGPAADLMVKSITGAILQGLGPQQVETALHMQEMHIAIELYG